MINLNQNSLTDIIEEQTNRALWEVKNVIDCIPEELLNKEYCAMPCWKHVYHMLHSLDLWPRVLGLEKPFPEGNFEKYF